MGWMLMDAGAHAYVAVSAGAPLGAAVDRAACGACARAQPTFDPGRVHIYGTHGRARVFVVIFDGAWTVHV